MASTAASGTWRDARLTVLPPLSSAILNEWFLGTSLAVQWLRLCASNARDAGSTPGQGTKIPYARWCSQKKKKKNFCSLLMEMVT